MFKSGLGYYTFVHLLYSRFKRIKKKAKRYSHYYLNYYTLIQIPPIELYLYCFCHNTSYIAVNGYYITENNMWWNPVLRQMRPLNELWPYASARKGRNNPSNRKLRGGEYGPGNGSSSGFIVNRNNTNYRVIILINLFITILGLSFFIISSAAISSIFIFLIHDLGILLFIIPNY